MVGMTPHALASFLEKVQSRDKDIRYMAANDLLRELDPSTGGSSSASKRSSGSGTSSSSASFVAQAHIEGEMELRLLSAVMKLLDDAATDVAGLAIKCLAPLIQHVSAKASGELVTMLFDKMKGNYNLDTSSGKSGGTKGKSGDPANSSDVASMGMKTIVSELKPSPMTSIVIRTLVPKIIAAINSSQVESDGKSKTKSASKTNSNMSRGQANGQNKQQKYQVLISDCLDILHVVLQRFGAALSENHMEVCSSILPILSSPANNVRKRSIQCLSSLIASTSSQDIVDMACEDITTNIEKLTDSNDNSNRDILRSYISAFGVLCSAGHDKVFSKLKSLITVIIQICISCAEMEDELRETCLQALDNFVTHCIKPVLASAMYGKFTQDEAMMQEDDSNVDSGDSDYSEVGKNLLTEILNVSLDYLVFDPNYTYEDDDADMDDDEDDDEYEGDEDEDDDDDYSDDEDQSWKVRRASSQVLSSIIKTCGISMETLYNRVAKILVSRFVEREESVKLSVFVTLIDLLKESMSLKASNNSTQSQLPMRGNHIIANSTSSITYSASAAHDYFVTILPSIIKATTKQLKDSKSVKVKIACFSVFKEVVSFLPTSDSSTGNDIDSITSILDNYVSGMIPFIEKALSDNSSNASSLRIEALILLRLILNTKLSHIVEFIPTLVVPIKSAMMDRYYKVAAESLRVSTSIIYVLTSSKSDRKQFDTQGKEFITTLYPAILERLTRPDQDQEVKEAAISAMSTMLALMGDVIEKTEKGRLDHCLPLLYDRTENETTRLSAVKGLTFIAHKSDISVHILSAVTTKLVIQLTTFLRKADRSLRMASMNCLLAFVDRYTLPELLANSNGEMENMVNKIVDELSTLTNVSDLQMAGFALLLSAIIMHQLPDMSFAVADKQLPAALTVLASPLLQGSSLTASHYFFASILWSSKQIDESKGTSFEMLFQSLMDSISSSAEAGNTLTRQASDNIASTIAVLCMVAGEDSRREVMRDLINSLKDIAKEGDDVGSTLSKAQDYKRKILCVGEIGRRAKLSMYDGFTEEVERLVSCGISSTNEEARSAASNALGNVTLGDIEHYVPFILGRISPKVNTNTTSNDTTKTEYTLLHSLKVVIACRGGIETGGTSQSKTLSSLDEYVVVQPVPLGSSNIQSMLKTLIENSGSEEVGVRNVVAECLGKLALAEPHNVMPLLDDLFANDDPLRRSTFLSVLKFAVMDLDENSLCAADPSTDMYSLIKRSISTVSSAIVDTNVDVRRNAVLLITAVLSSYPDLIMDQILPSGDNSARPNLMESLFSQLEVDQSLVRVVDLGPFKHTVDDGHDLRKSAYECCAVIVEKLGSISNGIDMAEFVKSLPKGLADTYDIKLLCTSIVIKLCRDHPGAVIPCVDAITDPVEKTLNIRLKTDAVKQEIDRHEDMLRMSLRLVDAITKLIKYTKPVGDPAAHTRYPRFYILMSKIEKATAFMNKLTAVREEGNEEMAIMEGR